MRYGIPPQIRPGFEALISLSDDEVKILEEIISAVKLGDGVKTVSEVHFGKIKSLEKETFRKMISSLFSIANIYTESKDTVEKFSEDFSSSFKEEFPDANANSAEKLGAVLRKILPAYRTIRLTSKAKDLLMDNVNNFSEGRIISDIRIVFDDEKKADKKQCAVLVHQLNIRHFTIDGKRQMFQVSLDSSDLKKLKRTIEWALEKDEIIRKTSHEFEFVDYNLSQ